MFENNLSLVANGAKANGVWTDSQLKGRRKLTAQDLVVLNSRGSFGSGFFVSDRFFLFFLFSLFSSVFSAFGSVPDLNFRTALFRHSRAVGVSVVQRL
jgi:hypothetical protein